MTAEIADLVSDLHACAKDPDSEKVASVIAALYYLANAENSAAIVAQGGLEALLVAQRTHAHHVHVNAEFVMALWRIACRHGQRAALEASGVIPVVRALMKEHPSHAGIQANGASLLQTCCT